MKCFFIFISLFFTYYIQAQNNSNIPKHYQQTIDTLPQLNAQQLKQWQWATEKQQSIIGNDFEGKQEIGTAAIRRPFTFAKKWQLAWLRPYTKKTDNGKAYKQTLCGTIHDVHHTLSSKAESIFFTDNDLSLFIAPDKDFDYMLREVPTVEHSIECEIDMKNIAQMDYLKNGHTAHKADDNVCVYGVWTNDVMHQTFLMTVEVGMNIEKKGHVEIHPREQTWWQKQYGDTTRYYCHLASDASKRFFIPNRLDPYKGTNLGNWTTAPLKGTFAIAFQKNTNEPTPQYRIHLTDSLNAQATNQQAYTQYELIAQQQTIAHIAIPENISPLFFASFQKVGLDTQGNIKGFLVIETTVGKQGNTYKEQEGGHIVFWVEKL